MKHEHIILASASPRRLQLLTEAGWRVKAIPADIDENIGRDEMPEQAVRRLALAKAEKIAHLHPQAVVIGADTVVCIDGIILGKPADYRQAKQMLQFLAGREHTVTTGVAVLRPRTEGSEDDVSKVWSVRSQVEFHPLSEKEIEDYLACIDPLDKAGAYAVQDCGDMIIADIKGSRANVMGLPIEELQTALKHNPA